MTLLFPFRYSSKEDREIIYFIVRNDYYPLVKGNVIWKDAEAEKICEGRTWQGLKERFRKKILPCIRSYNFPEEIAKKFQNIPKLSKRGMKIKLFLFSWFYCLLNFGSFYH